MSKQKPLYLTFDSKAKFVLPNTASAVGYDLTTNKQIYFNTSSNSWENQGILSVSNGLFSSLTASDLKLNGTPGIILNENGPLLISSSLGIITSGSIVFSGSRLETGVDQSSVLVNGDLFISGGVGLNDYLQLKPVDELRIPTNSTASYIYTSGSTNDLYFSQYNELLSSSVRLKWLEGDLNTGLLHGGLLSTVEGTTTFNITHGSGIFVSYNASIAQEPYPVAKFVEWPTAISQSLTYISSSQITYIGINSLGNVIQRTTPFIDGDFINYIPIGRISHLSGSVTNNSITNPNVGYGVNAFRGEFIRSFGPLKISGHVLAASGSTLGLTKTAGSSYAEGRNYETDPNNPNNITDNDDPAITVSKIYREYMSGTIPVIDTGLANAGYETIDPTKYLSNITNGTLSNVPNNKCSVQRVFWSPSSTSRALYVYYGNNIYNTLDIAQNALLTEEFIEGGNTVGASILVAYIIVREDCTDLSDTTKAKIIQAGLTRGTVGAGGNLGATVPGGLDTYVQFNDGGSTFGGDSAFTFQKTTSTLTTTNLILNQDLTVSGNVILGDVSTDIININGRLTASSGLEVTGSISGSLDVSIQRNLYTQGTSQFTGSAYFNKLTGSISGTLGGLPYIVGGTNITASYNNSGQWEITGSTPAQLGLGIVTATGATAAIARAVINTASSGTLAARPASPAAGDSYLATDYDVLLTCAVAGTWRVVGADVMNVTMGPFSGATTQTSLLSATGTGNGPVGRPGYTYAACVYITGTPVIPQIIAGYIDSVGISGWALKMGDTSGKFGLYQRGMLSNATADLGSAVGTGAHAVAVACAADGLSLCYSVDGGAVGTVAITGTYTPPSGDASVGVGNTFIASQAFIAGGISWVGVWSSVLSDADLRAVSAQYAAGLPGAASTVPAWGWLCAKYPDGLARHMPIGSAAKPLVITDTTRRLARTAR